METDQQQFRKPRRVESEPKPKGGFVPALKHVIKEESQVAEKSGGFVLPKHLRPPKQFTTRSKKIASDDGLSEDVPYDMSIHDCQVPEQVVSVSGSEDSDEGSGEDLMDESDSYEGLDDRDCEEKFRYAVEKYATRFGKEDTKLVVALALKKIKALPPQKKLKK